LEVRERGHTKKPTKPTFFLVQKTCAFHRIAGGRCHGMGAPGEEEMNGFDAGGERKNKGGKRLEGYP